MGRHADAIKYLYNNWPNDLVWVGSAFVSAAQCGETKIVSFLLDTGCISSEVFDLALEVAASPDWCGDWNIETAFFLCGKKRASPTLVVLVFERARYFPLIKYLYENEGVSDKAIFVAFEHATRMGVFEIFTFLYDEKSDSIPSEVLSRVFRTVVEHRLAKFFECLRHNHRISSDAIDAAFVSAAHNRDRIVLRALCEERQISPKAVDATFVSVARNGDRLMLESLYEKRPISPEVILKAFQAVSSCERGFSRVGGELVRYLCESRVPREFKYEALLYGVGEGRTLVMVQGALNKTGDWPLDILKKALDTARDDNTRNWIRKMICDQIFGGIPQSIRWGVDVAM